MKERKVLSFVKYLQAITTLTLTCIAYAWLVDFSPTYWSM